MVSFEELVLKQLIVNADFSTLTLPYLDKTFFREDGSKEVFGLIKDFVGKYRTLPTYESLVIDLSNRKYNEKIFKDISKKLEAAWKNADNVKLDWLINTTEEWAREQKIANALQNGIELLDKPQEKGKIIDLLKDALGFGFNSSVGLDYFEDYQKRFELYKQKFKRIPFDLEYFNQATDGGLSAGTLTIFIGGINVGKSLVLCHLAANNLVDGYNVLYLSLEMSREQVMQRIDANLLDISMKNIKTTPEPIFESKVKQLKAKTTGRLIVERYPTASAHVGHFRALISELELKKNFKPNIIYIDYLNIAASYRYGYSENSYTYVKGVAEEFRGLGVELNVPIITATQVNREGFNSSDYGMGETSDSLGVPMTADTMFAIFSPEEMKKLGQYKIKHLKSRDTNIGELPYFVIGVDYDKMRLYNLDDEAQNIIKTVKKEDKPVFDKSDFGLTFNDISKELKNG